MRFTCILRQQHIGWHFKKHWQVQGKRVPYDSGAALELKSKGFEIVEAESFLNSEREYHWLENKNQLFNVPQEVNLNPPTKPCYVYNGTNLTLGLRQAQVLTNSIEVKGLPEKVEKSFQSIQLSKAKNRNVQKAILATHFYDAEQVKLEKVGVIDRPGFRLPRRYGTSESRKTQLLIKKLIFECEKMCGQSISIRRSITSGSHFKVVVNKDGALLQFDVDIENVLTSSTPIDPTNDIHDGQLPDLYPLDCKVSIPIKQICSTDTFYPLHEKLPNKHPHTIFHHSYDISKSESAINVSHFQSKSLLKTFAVAATRAKQLYGDQVVGEDLPEPIVMQSIQTDGRSYYFGILQLNTLSLDKTSNTKNYWFHEPVKQLFERCVYREGRPILEGYNKDIFCYIGAFYNNC